MKYHHDGFYTSELLEKFNIVHGFGTREFVFSEFTGNKQLLKPITKQIHSDKVYFFGDLETEMIYEGDGWITNREGVIPYVVTADCLPLLLFDPDKGIAAAIHAGWKSLVQHIIAKSIKIFTEKGSNTANIIAAIGPHIGSNCYQVGDDVLQTFKKNNWNDLSFFEKNDSGLYLSLKDAAYSELIDIGLRKDSIDNSLDLCSHCLPDKFYSHRSNSSEVKRQYSFICMDE